MKIKNEDYIEWRKYFSVVIMCKDTFLGTSYTKNKNQKIGKIMCTHYCCVLIEDIFIHLVMRFPGTETRIKKTKQNLCTQLCCESTEEPREIEHAKWHWPKCLFPCWNYM